ncbi:MULTISPECIES: hypothetical protein [Winogradskyella]|uniref:Uncharacterized protein n=1 Tax=Winogradskyella marincola TaxID=3037795 RepID=A0ABT6G0D5_9FLAO|nr:hypothetical protein [Winogradskyella sp. YYF002]MDG4715510.1 hypothetical protein [Winogradskyella sp. YYF002]
MRQTVQNKITNLKALAKGSVSNSVAKSSSRIVNDNLSKAIRSERDAKVFRKELTIAFKLAKE